MAMDLTWKKHEPKASPFAIVAGNPTEYVVYSLSVPSADEEDVRAAIDESVAQMCRLAHANVTPRTEIVLFEWDSVYSTLTVVYTDRERSFDAGEVLKVFVAGWRAESAEMSEDEQLEIWEQREGLVRTWLRRALRLPGTQATLASLAGRGIVPAFTAQHHATEFEPL
jgi:hypothetical protein